MKKKGFIILGILIIGLIVVLDSTAPPEVNWHKTYHENKKQPFDLKVFHDQLDTVFYDYKIKTLKETFYEYQNRPLKMMSLEKDCLYINIDENYEPDKASEEQLLGYIGRGNIAFISASYFSNSLLDSLKIKKLKKGKRITQLIKNPLSLFLKNNSASLTYTPKLKYFQSYFKDSTNLNVLGTVQFTSNDSIVLKKPNFIEVPYKNGLFYLHTQPEAFTNYHLLKFQNSEYINQVLSLLPTKITDNQPIDYLDEEAGIAPTSKNHLYFESNHKASSELINSPLRFIRAHKGLHWAWKLILSGFALFFLINAKRKQRIIPIKPLVKNTSLEFVATIASLYEDADNFQPIIEQKIHIFYKNIRNRYNLVTDNTNNKLVKQLSTKSGYDLAKTKELIRFINTLKNRETSSINLLTKLNTEIENFYKNTTAWKN